MTDNHTTGVRFRAILLGIVLAALICVLTPYNNTYKQATPLGGGHFPLAPFFILVWLTLLAAGLGRLFRRIILNGKELLLIWMLMVMVSGIAYTGLARTFFVNLTAPFHFATVGNGWEETLQPLLPGGWHPQDAEAIEQLYNGLPDGRRMGWIEVLKNIPWDAWTAPLLYWWMFIFLSYWIMLCIVNLLSRQWIYNERMNMPLLRVPFLMEDALDKGRLGQFFLNRFFIAGICFPLCLHLLNGLNFYYPEVPQIPTLVLAGSYFPKHGLFSGFHKLKIYIYPAFIGFAFLTSRQISFSFWFFFILGGLLYGVLGLLGYNIPAAALGTIFGPTLSHPEEMQMVGAYLIFFFFILWLARHHILEVIRRSFGRGDGVSPQEETEWISPVISFWGFIIGLICLVIWFVWFGMPLLVTLLVVIFFFIFMVVASRVICQGGIAYFTLTVAPIDGLIAFLGPQFFTKIGLVGAAVSQKVLFVDLRESLMPSLVHGSGVTHGMKNKRLIFFAMAAALVIGVIASFGATLALCYKFGARELQLDWTTRTTTTVYANIKTLMETQQPPADWVIIFSLIGAGVMLLLVICYHRFYWWPIHPIGYLTAYSSAMRILWLSFFIGWLANSLCIRYGGVVLFKKLRYFFIGLIVGDFLMGGIWAVIGLFGDGSYQVLPN